MQPDGARTVLVVGERPQLWLALSASLDAGLAQVRWAPVSRALEGLRACRPWPWLVAGDGAGLPGEFVRELEAVPAPVYWCGAGPRPEPRRLRRFDDWRELLSEVQRLTRQSLAGLTLNPERGVRAGPGRVIRSPDLECLLAFGGEPASLPPRTLANARRALAAHGVPLRLALREGLATPLPRTPG